MNVAEPQKAQEMSGLEIEAIEMFINFLKLIGLPKTVGELYGLLFVSPRQLAMDEMMARLEMSLGAASQGLKLLKGFGAVRVVYVPGSRRDHFVADLELSRFATVFIKEELQPRMATALERIERMEEMASTLGPAEKKDVTLKIERLKHWLKKGRTMLPWILKFLVR